MRAGRPRSRGDLLPLMGWGDGRVRRGSIFFMNIDAQDAQEFFRKRACIPGNPQTASPGPAVQQPLVLFILFILCIDVNKFSGDACR